MSFSTIKAIAFTAVFAAATPLAYAQSATELEEDFSLFTAGSESEPSSAISNETGTIPSSYFHQSGWSGYGVHQAGGACALISPDNYGAQLYTPLGAYIGEYEVKVRAKTLASNYRDNAQLTIGLWEDAATQYNQTPYHEPFTTTKSEWREFTFYFNNTSYNSSNLLIAFSTLDKVLIDDVKISRPTTLTAPTPAGISGFKADGFTAHWNAVNGATHYLFSLFHDVKEGETEEQTFLENFTSMKTSGKLPEGWGYKSQSGKEPEFFEKSADGIKGALLFKNGDVITMPDNGGYYNTLEINIVECKMPKNAEEIGDAQIIVELFDGHAWKKFTTIYVDASDSMVRTKYSTTSTGHVSLHRTSTSVLLCASVLRASPTTAHWVSQTWHGAQRTPLPLTTISRTSALRAQASPSTVSTPLSTTRSSLRLATQRAHRLRLRLTRLSA